MDQGGRKFLQKFNEITKVCYWYHSSLLCQGIYYKGKKVYGTGHRLFSNFSQEAVTRFQS